MAAYHPTTLRAAPLCHLFLQKPLHTVLSNVLKVLDHAHMVKSAIALVESLEPAAREILAVVAKPHESLFQQCTLPFVVTLLVAR